MPVYLSRASHETMNYSLLAAMVMDKAFKDVNSSRPLRALEARKWLESVGRVWALELGIGGRLFDKRMGET